MSEQQSRLYNLLHRPVITEKSTELAALNQYVFYVDKFANKVELIKAFELAYPDRKVSKVRVVKVPGEQKRSGRKMGRIAERRKAIFSIVGEPIEFMAGGV